MKILKEFGLETLTRAELCLLLLQSDYTLLPSICFDYNNGAGLNGQCKDNCQRLHICEKYLTSDCSCLKTHNFYAPQPLKCLQEKHIHVDLFPSLKSIYANKEALRFADKPASRGCNRGNRGGGGSSLAKRAVSCGDLLTAVDTDSKGNSSGRPNHRQRDKAEICMFFIKGHCKHEDRCFKAHDKMPYRWEIKQDDRWTPMAENEKIEQDYCNPQNTYSTTSPPVNFDTMTSGNNEVRRLSTMNSVLEPDYIHTTEWLWYWEDEYGKWYQYAAVTSEHRLASITSKDLEERFVKNDKDEVEFTTGSHRYSLSFQDMIQTNLKYSTKRLVRRRPKFVSAADVQTKRKRPANGTAVPDYWDKTQISQSGYKRVTLQPCSEEYKEMQGLFSRTMPSFNIINIERIQNKALWEAFQLQKIHMKNRNGGQPVTEKKLFHGTDPTFVDTICATNFDWRVCGVNGTAYGQGSYFAQDAKYSHRYTGTSDVHSMFVSRVLVGEYTKGQSEYRRPPSKDGGNINLYNSCVDNVANPSIFVVFEKHQIYPEYLLQYEQRSPDTDPLEVVSQLRNRLAVNVPTASPFVQSLLTDSTQTMAMPQKLIKQAAVGRPTVTKLVVPPRTVPSTNDYLLQMKLRESLRRASNLLEAPIPVNIPKPTITPTSVTVEKPKVVPKPIIIPPCLTRSTIDSQPATSSSRTLSASYLYTLEYLKKL